MQIPYTKIRIKASRWPWMRRTKPALLEFDAREGDKYGWFKNSTLGRFGGGFQWSLGIQISGVSIHIDLLFGRIVVSWYQPKKKNA